MQLRRAVVGWDGSAPAGEALRWAADAETRRGGALHVVRVLDPALAGNDADHVAEVRQSLQDLAAGLTETHPDLPVTAEIVVGHAADELARLAGRSGMLVVGASTPGRARHPDARRLPVAIAGRGEGLTAVVPSAAPADRSGVVAVLRGRERSDGPLAFAARIAGALGEPLTLVRLSDPYEPVGGERVTLAKELRALARDFPGVAVTLDPRWVRSPLSLLTHSDRASLLVLEGRRPTTAPPRFSLERWLAGMARAPFVVVAEPEVSDDGHRTGSRNRLVLAG